MDFERLGLLLTVKELQLTHQYFINEPQVFILRGILILPRSNVDTREALRVIKSTDSGELIGSKTQFHENVLFKQSVQGPFSFGLQLSKPVSEDGFSKIAGKMAEAAVETAGALLAVQAFPPLRAGVRGSARFFAGMLSNDDPSVLAEDYAAISRKSTHTIKMVLSATTSMGGARKRKGPKSKRTHSLRKPNINVGDPIALAKVQLKFFN